MKKLILILTLLMSLKSFGQFPNPAPNGNDKTLWYQRGAIGTGSGFQFMLSFPDTVSANTGFNGVQIKNIAYFLISVGDSSLYLRNGTHTKWIKINGGGSGSPVTASNGLTKVGDDVQLFGTFSQDNTINAAGFNFTWNNLNSWQIRGTDDMIISTTNGGLSNNQIFASTGGAGFTANANGRGSNIYAVGDTAYINASLGNLVIDTLNNLSYQNVLQGWTSTSGANRGKAGYVTLGTGLDLISGQLSVNASAIAWTPTGNAGTTAGTNFVGTTDDVDLVFKRNNLESGRIGYLNTALGREAGYLAIGIVNTYIGANSGAGNSANGLTAVGLSAGNSNSGYYSSFLGTDAGTVNSGYGVIGIGSNTAATNSGDSVTAVGTFSAAGNSGARSTFLGMRAGYKNNVSNTYRDGIALGYAATLSANKQLALSDSITQIKAIGMASTNGYVLTDNGSGIFTPQAPTGSSVTASNGLTKSSDDIKLGGTIVQTTDVDGGGFDLTWDNFLSLNSQVVGDNSLILLNAINSGSTRQTNINIYPDSLKFFPSQGNLTIDTLNNLSYQNVLQGWTSTSGANRGKVGYVTLGTGLDLISGQLSVNASAIAWTPTGNTGTNPSTNFAGTTDGTDFVIKANSIEFDRRVPYVGTDTGYFGYVINSDYRTSPADFATQFTAFGSGSSSTVAGGKQISGDGFYIPNIWPSTVLTRFTYRAVGIKTAANNGLALREEPVTAALNYFARLTVEYDFNAKTATITLSNGSGTTTLATSSALASIATGDSVACIFNMDDDSIHATITNLNTAATTTVSYKFTAPNYAPTISAPCVLNALTANPVVIQSMQVYLDAYKNPDFTFVGHSIIQSGLLPVIQTLMPDYKIQSDAMGSMKIADFLYWVAETRRINGKWAVIGFGANDPGSVTNDATFYSGYRRDRDSLYAITGRPVIHFSQFPQDTYDFTARNDSLKTLYESLGDVFINVFPLLKNGSGYGWNPTYGSGDGVHPNAAGDSLIASQFALAVSSFVGPPQFQNYIDFSQRGNLQKVFSYETQQAFNSNLDIPDKGYVDSVLATANIAIGDTILNATAKSILYAGASGVLAQSNSQLSFDYTNNRVGIGTASPTYAIDVQKNENTASLINLANSSSGSSASSILALRTNAGSYGALSVFSTTNGTLPSGTVLESGFGELWLSTINAYPIKLRTANTDRVTISSAGAVTIADLAGSGTRMVEASSTGLLSATNAAPTSGTYTPTLTNTTNVSSSTPIVCHYIRVGNQVTVSGSVTFTTTATGATVLGISLPIASNFGATTDATGNGIPTAYSTVAESNYVEGNTTSDRAELKCTSLSAASVTVFFTFTYTVI